MSDVGSSDPRAPYGRKHGSVLLPGFHHHRLALAHGFTRCWHRVTTRSSARSVRSAVCSTQVPGANTDRASHLGNLLGPYPMEQQAGSHLPEPTFWPSRVLSATRGKEDPTPRGFTTEPGSRQTRYAVPSRSTGTPCVPALQFRNELTVRHLCRRWPATSGRPDPRVSLAEHTL